MAKKCSNCGKGLGIFGINNHGSSTQPLCFDCKDLKSSVKGNVPEDVLQQAINQRVADLASGNVQGTNSNEVISVFMEQAKKLASEKDMSKYLGKGGFNSIKEIEASFFISLLVDMTGGSIDNGKIVNLVKENYGLNQETAQKFLQEFMSSRGH